MKIVFFGGGKYAVPALDTLRDNFEIIMVVTNPEKPIGRQQIPEPSAVELKAKELGLPVKIVHEFDAETVHEIRKLAPEVMVIIDYGKIIPKKIIDIPPKGAINVHPSALPKYRGASPLQTAILSGETKTAISIMLIDEEMDHGPILLQKPVEIKPDDTYGSLYTRLSKIYPPLLIEAMQGYMSGDIKPKEQDHDKVTFTKLLKRSDGKIDWTKPAADIMNMIRAFDPWPGTSTLWERNGKPVTLKILKAQISSEDSLPAGQASITDSKLLIGTGSEPLEILELQLAGKPAMDAKKFVNGYQDINNANLTTK